MSIIDSTYFRGRLALSQVGNPQGLIIVNQFIADYEDEFLQCVLGFDLWNAFLAGIDDSNPEDRWLWLLNGQNYTWKGCNGSWTGFSNDVRRSPIANFVYFQFIDAKATDYVLTGNVVSDTENNRTVNIADRQVDTWNAMVEMNLNLLRFLNANKALYPEWKRCHHCECECGCHNEQYKGCTWDVFKKRNTFDL